MSNPIKCPTCGRELKILDNRHIQSKKHQKALEEQNISPKDDPALKLIEEGESTPSPQEEKKNQKNSLKPLTISPLKLNSSNSNKKEKEEEKEKEKEELESKDLPTQYSTEEEKDLAVPTIPEPPKKERIEINSSDLSIEVIKRMKKYDHNAVKMVLLHCERCNEVIVVPVPKKLILNSKQPIIPISYVHWNLDNKDKHCITLFLDHDFDIRRQRVTDVIIAERD